MENDKPRSVSCKSPTLIQLDCYIDKPMSPEMKKELNANLKKFHSDYLKGPNGGGR